MDTRTFALLHRLSSLLRASVWDWMGREGSGETLRQRIKVLLIPPQQSSSFFVKTAANPK